MTASTATYPLDLIADPRLTHTACRLLAILPQLATNATTGEVSASHSQLAMLLKASKRTITNAVKLLREIGILDCIPGSGRSVSRYRIPDALANLGHTRHTTAPPPVAAPAAEAPAHDVVKNQVVVVNKTNNQQQIYQDFAPAPAPAPAPAHESDATTPDRQRYAKELQGLTPEAAKELLTELDAARKIHNIRSPRGYLRGIVENYRKGIFTPTATEQLQAQQQQAHQARQQQNDAITQAERNEAAHWDRDAQFILREIVAECAADKTGQKLGRALKRELSRHPHIAPYLQQRYDEYCNRPAEKPPTADATFRRRMFDGIYDSLR